MSKSTTVLTPEQSEFFQLCRVRATTMKFGQPYIAYALFKLIPVNSPGLKTMAVDEFYRCYIDFDYFMNEKSLEFAAGVLNHEPWHLLRDSWNRHKMAGDYTNKLWNYAHDLEINDDIESIIPKDLIFPRNFSFPENETAEWYARELQKLSDKNKKKNKQKGNKSEPGKGEDSGDGSGSGSDLRDTFTDGKCDGDCQSGSDGQPCYEDHSGNDNECGTDEDKLREYKLSESEAPTVPEFEKELIAQEVARQIRETAERDPGSIKGNMKLWADSKLVVTKTPWQKTLRAGVRSSITRRGKADYVMNRPSRRQPVKDILLPGMRSPKPRIAMGVDTSGSHVPMLPAVLNEVNTIVKQVGAKGEDFRVFSIDTEMSGGVKRVNNVNNIEFTGGGGTEMLPAFEWAGENRKDIDSFILMTDGEFYNWPPHTPSNTVNFVVCVLREEGSSSEYYDKAVSAVGAWAKVLDIEVPSAQIDRG